MLNFDTSGLQSIKLNYEHKFETILEKKANQNTLSINTLI